MIRLGLTKKGVMDFGRASGCTGCIASNQGMRRNRSDSCRKLMDGVMEIYGGIMVGRYAQGIDGETVMSVTQAIHEDWRADA